MFDGPGLYEAGVAAARNQTNEGIAADPAGPAPEDGIDAKILQNLGRGDAKEIAVFPILIRGQVVNLLYTDAGSDALGETNFAALDSLTKLVSCAYERLILNKKSALRQR